MSAPAELAAGGVASSPAYRSAWSAFCAWCQARGEDAIPAAPETVVTYIAQRYRVEHCRPATLDVAVAAILKAHEAAGLARPDSPPLRALCQDARRRMPRATAVPLDDVRAVVKACGEKRRGLRDRAVILSIHHGRLSRVAMAALDVEHLAGPPYAALLTPDPDPLLCPKLALERWLAARGNPQSGPVFVTMHAGLRLRPSEVSRILRVRCEAAGVRGLTPLALRLHPTKKEPQR